MYSHRIKVRTHIGRKRNCRQRDFYLTSTCDNSSMLPAWCSFNSPQNVHHRSCTWITVHTAQYNFKRHVTFQPQLKLIFSLRTRTWILVDAYFRTWCSEVMVLSNMARNVVGQGAKEMIESNVTNLTTD